MSAHGEQNPLAAHPFAHFIRTGVRVCLNEPHDERGLEALRRELELSLDVVTARIREARLHG